MSTRTSSSAAIHHVQRKLKGVRATNVLGGYNHEVRFDDDSEFVIVYGPNGIGKTRLLEVIHALLRLDTVTLSAAPFGSLELEFTDGTFLSVQSEQPTVNDFAAKRVRYGSGFRNESKPLPRRLIFRLATTFRGIARWTADVTTDFPIWLAYETQWMPTADLQVWTDKIDGEQAQLAQLRRMYSYNFAGDEPPTFEVPDDFTKFAENTTVRLIETQRLLGSSKEAYKRSNDGTSVQPAAAILDYSNDIKQLLAETLTSNSRLTQLLDSTFPRRMLDRGDTSALTEDEVRDKWTIQRKKRARLAAIADLGVDPHLSLPKNALNAWQLSMLELYLSDADEKLGSFESVLHRIDLLEEIINDRFINKHLTVNAAHGLVVTRHLDESVVDLTSLSSGEQHELILIFDLLFKARRGSIVLIDEPEISLHVAWQLRFIEDVRRISRLVGFQFIVATHSPQIIDRWWTRAAQLGPDIDFHGNTSRHSTRKGRNA